MLKANTSESAAEVSDYKKTYLAHKEEIETLKGYLQQYPDDKTIPLLLKIAKLRFLILKLHR